MTQKARNIQLGALTVGNSQPFVLIAGPCQIESAAHALETASALKEICEKAEIGLIYKSSFDKANRTSLSSARGVGMHEGLSILADVRERLSLPVLTDVHAPEQCAPVAEAVDVLQIPAFLCRQTDLLLAVGRTGAAVNVKKGQFLAPWDMQHVAAKIASTGNHNIMLCERGTSFGYNTLVNDMRGLPVMAQTGYPVVFDATHSVQQPGGLGGASGGQREFAPVLSRAALAIGVAALFIETHQNPDHAPSDGPNMLPLTALPTLLKQFKAFDDLAKAIR
ncbi:3-deoxy-8-phosphooctulonate synthase [Acetobacter orientalis]|uniref:2-dehydro-3-deoxyphosphooctonate aldolase n=1 Tax=Acetobacter orientalis TaxID=146474 RepID=A0A2Z5ZDC6_9PROT|nr:3-deoxy-8-phosphooctulonate synthase [Acetobacter orientalis]BBC78662.1 3-deoxy-8-phosphooctulonate synthase [Acetobacter orientalis]GAN66778.1 3-deoxy-8-phosphooctulonate synthase [Acetobacter orientalis]GBR13989.1 3-deoxy-8-phosphooctulonate synthase [Acetobacter orientalis NRIC 0481]GEL60776.1 2-dehydro-3-deoxyphosphooctonate aldolase [Acetobacter orientalis]